MNNPRLLGALAYLSTNERIELARGVRAMINTEAYWQRRFQERIQQLDERVFRSLWDHGKFAQADIDFLPLVLEHSYRMMLNGFRDALKHKPMHQRLASPPGIRIPRSLADLKELWDRWRRGRDIPQRQQVMAEKIKRAYLKRVQSVWEKHSEAFREGQAFDMREVKAVLRQQGDMASARAEMIVGTETTYYYNKARRRIYDRSDDVTHYLFVAIRDKATTRWCATRQGLVYKKGDPLLERETPPCHWWCRSELLPLTMQNPRHRKLIEDRSRARRNNRCEPLPAGWGRR